jgi:tetratricopeptide (TPR) repeat protein
MLEWIKGVFAWRQATVADGAQEGASRVDGWMRNALDLHRAGDSARAEQVYLGVLEEQPDHAEALYFLGEIEALRQNNEHAASLIRRAISIDDAKAQHHFALGCVLQASGESRGAVACYRRALAIDSSHVPAHLNLGFILQQSSETDFAAAEEALAHFQAATELAPDAADGWLNLGYASERGSKLALARSHYDRALAIDPGLVQARFNRSLVLLAQGHYAEGWQDYEWRWQASGYPRPAFPKPEWDGRQLHGETVFLYTEQGFGDVIQFVRYAALVAERGGRAILRCQPELARLLKDAPGVSATLAPDRVPEFDFHCPLLSLPRVMRTTLETIPAQIPYIHPDPMRVAEWRSRVGDGQPGARIGLVWSSQSLMPNAALKSATLQVLAPLGEVPGVRFYSLQMGAAGKQATQTRPFPLVDHTDKITDFSDTAALIANLDLVLSVDTAVAHLAGAMGKPVWTMLRNAPDWRWYPDERASRWYPGMRLYRQQLRGDWRALSEEIAADLRDFVAAKVATSPT